MELSLKQRLISLAERKSSTVAAFERECNLSNGTIGNMKNNLSSESIRRISKTYPDVRLEWLIHGDGEMLHASVSQTNTNGDNINGASVSVTKTEGDTSKILAALERQCGQFDVLINILERMQKNGTSL